MRVSVPDGRDELRSVVEAEARRLAMYAEQRDQQPDEVLDPHTSCHQDHARLLSELVQHWQPLQSSPFLLLLYQNIVAPAMVLVLGIPACVAQFAAAQALPFCAGEYIGLEEIDATISSVYFGPLTLGHFHERHTY